MFSKFITVEQIDKFNRSGLAPLVSGILLKVKRDIKIVEMYDNVIGFGTDTGLTAFRLSTHIGIDSSAVEYCVTNMTSMWGKDYSNVVTSKNTKYILKKFKDLSWLDGTLNMIEQSMNGKTLTNTTNSRWDRKYHSTVPSVGRLDNDTILNLVKVYLNTMQASQMSDVDDLAIKKVHDTHLEIERMEGNKGKDKQDFFSKDRYVWVKMHRNNRIMVGRLAQDNTWAVPLTMYMTEQDVPADIRDPILARLTMAAMLRNKTTGTDEWHDGGKLYPAYTYWQLHTMNEIELFTELEMVVEYQSPETTMLSMTVK